LGLAGIKHALNQDRTREETHAMITDLIIGIVGVGSALIVLLG